MTKEEELEDMPLWQNHEQRITALEITTANIKHEFTEIKDRIDRGNLEQSKKLETIDNRLMEEFFKKKNINHENAWKLIIKVAGALVGAGSFIYLLIEKIF